MDVCVVVLIQTYIETKLTKRNNIYNKYMIYTTLMIYWIAFCILLRYEMLHKFFQWFVSVIFSLTRLSFSFWQAKKINIAHKKALQGTRLPAMEMKISRFFFLHLYLFKSIWQIINKSHGKCWYQIYANKTQFYRNEMWHFYRRTI